MYHFFQMSARSIFALMKMETARYYERAAAVNCRDEGV